MSSFVITAILITLVTLGLLIWPLRKNRGSASYARQAQNIHYAKERIKELDEQLENASISATDYEALKLEIENTLANDIDIDNIEADQTSDANSQSNKPVIAALCVSLPIAALVVYSIVGMPESFRLLAEQKNPSPQQHQTNPSNVAPEQINQMLVQIEERLKTNPNDVKGWTVLSRTYISLGRYDDAKRSLIKLMELQGESAAILTTIADASGLSAQGNLVGEPQQYLERALKLDPNFTQALWMSGLAAAQQKDNATAVKYWEKLLPLMGAFPEQQAELRQLIKTSKGEITNQTQIVENEPTISSTGLQIKVSIDPNVAEQAKPSDLVFVFAKALQGPPAPLAVKRLKVSELPTTINLSDTDAMIDQFKLSLFEDVTINARVSKSGNPIAQPGDFESDSVTTKNSNSEEITLVISSEVK